MSLVIAGADAAHLEAINAVIESAKRSLGYDEAYVAAALALLRIDADYLAHSMSFQAALDGRIVGFAAVEWSKAADDETSSTSTERALLDHVWIAPEVQRQGIGRQLVTACVESAKARGVARLMIYADPPSEAFYLQLGARRVGTKSSRIAGGPVFPLLVLTIA